MSTEARAGLSDWQWIGVAVLVIAVLLVVLEVTGGLDTIRAKEAAKVERAAAREVESAERLKVQGAAGQLAKSDAVELANKGIRPTRSEVRKLGIERAKAFGIPATESAAMAWQMTYEAVFKRTYKDELDW